jgi:hypothetical protein
MQLTAAMETRDSIAVVKFVQILISLLILIIIRPIPLFGMRYSPYLADQR